MLLTAKGDIQYSVIFSRFVIEGTYFLGLWYTTNLEKSRECFMSPLAVSDHFPIRMIDTGRSGLCNAGWLFYEL